MGDAERSNRIDCLVIGGGPAGLTAAIYLARFHLSVIVVDSGDGRALTIPLTRNHAGFPDGISGADLVDRMRRQAQHHDVSIVRADVADLVGQQDDFVALAPGLRIMARTILLATGVSNNRPPMIDAQDHDDAVARGLIRYCPICDGYEASDRRIAVLGTAERGHAEALFLRSFSAHVTLVAPQGGHDLTDDQRAELQQAGIEIEGTCVSITLRDSAIELQIGSAPRGFDTLYPALGSRIRSELAAGLGAEMSNEGCIIVDTHQRTSVAGLYAAGDVVLGLDQISHAMGEGGVAATTIRNDLARRAPLRR